MTPEAKAWQDSWDEYIRTDDYKGCVKAMLEKGMKQPYIDNIIRRGYDHAWWACRDRLKVVTVERIVEKKVIEYRRQPPTLHPYKPKK